MSSISSDEIISILKNEIENLIRSVKTAKVGTVVSVGDGIANIYGIEHAMYGEIVTFENGLKGMVQDIQERYDRLHPVRIRFRDQTRAQK